MSHVTTRWRQTPTPLQVNTEVQQRGRGNSDKLQMKHRCVVQEHKTNQHNMCLFVYYLPVQSSTYCSLLV